MNKVTFDKAGNVLVNGAIVATMEGSSEVYIRMANSVGHFVTVARFKYRSPKSGAKHWLKFILAVMTSAEIVKALTPVAGQRGETPLGLAEKLGYVSLNVLKVREEMAKRELLRTTPMIMNHV